MRRLSQAVFAVVTLLGFAFLLIYKGVPQVVPGTHDTVTDAIFQPFLAALWGMLGYLINAMVVAVIVVVILNLAHFLITLVWNWPPRAEE